MKEALNRNAGGHSSVVVIIVMSLCVIQASEIARADGMTPEGLLKPLARSARVLATARTNYPTSEGKGVTSADDATYEWEGDAMYPEGEFANANTEAGDEWYSWFWPLGDPVKVNTLNDDYVAFRTESSTTIAKDRLPARPELAVEVGDGFLDTGKLDQGFEVPVIGAVWQPRLWAYAINRTAFQSYNSGAPGSVRETEIANRLDIFINLQLTGTEKLLVGLRSLDGNRPDKFTRYTFSGRNEGFNEELNLGLETLFFEGDVGSLFPFLDQAGIKPIDYGFTVGRQPVIFQEGILINDTIDAVGIVRNNIPFPGTSNFRVSTMWGWNRLDRNDEGRDADQNMFGMFIAADTHLSTFNLDMIYVDDNAKDGLEADGFYIGASAIQRLPFFYGISTAFRVNASFALDEKVPSTVGGSVVGDGVLLTAEFSKTVKGSDDIIYFNPFLGIGNYTQAGREAVVGGPLANTGILFASPNLSTYLSELNPFILDDVIGAAIGYQAFFDHGRRNLIMEIAGRKDLSGNGFDSLGFGLQLQQAVGQHFQLTYEAFYTLNENRDDGLGGRVEIQVVY